jgi:hypothetical protein
MTYCSVRRGSDPVCGGQNHHASGQRTSHRGTGHPRQVCYVTYLTTYLSSGKWINVRRIRYPQIDFSYVGHIKELSELVTKFFSPLFLDSEESFPTVLEVFRKVPKIKITI